MLQTVPTLLGGKVVRTAYGPTFTIVDDGHVDSDRMRGDIEDFIFEFYLDIVKRIVDIAKLQRSDFGIDANIPDDIAEVVFSGPTFEAVTEMDWETLFKIYSYSKRGLDNQEIRDLVEEVEDEIKSSLSAELREAIQ